MSDPQKLAAEAYPDGEYTSPAVQLAFRDAYARGYMQAQSDEQETYQAALAAAPTHVPPPRTAFLEHCEVEIYEGLTYVRLDDVMHLLSKGAPSEEPSDAPEYSYEAIRTDLISALAADGFAYLEAEQLVRQFEMLVRAFDPDAVIHARIRPRTQSEREAWDDGFAFAAGVATQEPVGGEN